MSSDGTYLAPKNRLAVALSETLTAGLIAATGLDRIAIDAADGLTANLLAETVRVKTGRVINGTRRVTNFDNPRNIYNRQCTAIKYKTQPSILVLPQ